MLRAFVFGTSEGHQVPLSCIDLYEPSSNNTTVLHEAHLVSSDLSKKIFLWNPNEISKPVGSLIGSHSVCHQLLFSKNEQFKIYGACDKDILIWDERNSQHPLHSWKIGIEKITSFDLCEYDNCLAVSNEGTNILFLSTIDGSLLYSKSTLHTDIISEVKFRPNKKWNQFITGSFDGSILFTDRSPRGKAKAILELCEYQDLRDVIESDSDDIGTGGRVKVRCLACSDSGKYVVAGLHNGNLMTVTTATKNPGNVETVRCHSGAVNCVTFVQDGYVLSGGQDCMLTCIKMEPAGSYQQRIINDRPLRQIRARSLSRVFVSDISRHIYMFDMSRM